MPETTVVTPAAAVPADRLTLGATDPRGNAGAVLPLAITGFCTPAGGWCMAEE